MDTRRSLAQGYPAIMTSGADIAPTRTDGADDRPMDRGPCGRGADQPPPTTPDHRHQHRWHRIALYLSSRHEHYVQQKRLPQNRIRGTDGPLKSMQNQFINGGGGALIDPIAQSGGGGTFWSDKSNRPSATIKSNSPPIGKELQQTSVFMKGHQARVSHTCGLYV